MDDLYKRLGVSPKASQKDIRSAYRHRARKIHPDVSQSPDTAEEFAKITEAYRILSDADRRARYDRGETVTAKATFYASHRQEVIAFQRKMNRIVDEIIENDRQETRARGQVVTVLVTLFLSTFVIALIKPIRFDPVEWPLLATGALLALVGIWYLIAVLRKAFKRYTYQPVEPSITSPVEPPMQPFTRSAALAFLTLGYLGSLAGGLLIDQLAGGAFSGGGVPRDAMFGAFVCPPILVMIISALRKLGEVMEPN